MMPKSELIHERSFQSYRSMGSMMTQVVCSGILFRWFDASHRRRLLLSQQSPVWKSLLNFSGDLKASLALSATVTTVG